MKPSDSSNERPADHDTLFVTVEADTRLAVRWTPGPDGAPVVVVVPALGVVARSYRHVAAELRRQGMGVAVVDLRGTGASTPRVDRSSAHGFHTTAAVDLPAVLQAVRSRAPAAGVVVLGHSLGGQIAPMFLSRAQSAVAGLALVSAGTPHYRAFAGARGLRGAIPLASTNLMAGMAKVFGYWPGDRLQFGGRQSRVLVSDWARLCRTGRYRVTDADVDYEALMTRFELPVLAVDVAGDQLAPPSAVDGLLAHLPRCHVTRRTCEQALGHIGWTARPAAVVDLVAPWVHEVAAGQHRTQASERDGDAFPRG